MPIHHRQFLIGINQRKRLLHTISPPLPLAASHHVIHELLPQSTLHEVVPQPGPPPPRTARLVLPPLLLHRQILRHVVFQPLRVDLLRDLQGGPPLPEVGQPGRRLLRLREQEVAPLREVALEEEVGLAAFPGLTHQFEQSRLLLAVEVGLEGSLAADVAQRHAPLPLLQELQLHHAQLSVQGGAQLHMREVMPHPQLQHLHPSELRCEFGQPQPEAFPAVLREFQQRFLVSHCLPDGQESVHRLPSVALVFAAQPPLLGVDGVVLAEALRDQLQKFAVFGGVFLDLEGEGVAAGEEGEQSAAGGPAQLVVPPHRDGQRLFEDVRPELAAGVAGEEGLTVGDADAVVEDEALPPAVPAQPHPETPLPLRSLPVLEQPPQQPLALLRQNVQHLHQSAEFGRHRLHFETPLPQQLPPGVDRPQLPHVACLLDQVPLVALREICEFGDLLLLVLAVDLLDDFGPHRFPLQRQEVVADGPVVLLPVWRLRGAVGHVCGMGVDGQGVGGGFSLDADLQGEFLLHADLLEFAG